jgi:hypothetical protein
VRAWLKENPDAQSLDPNNTTTFGSNAERNQNRGLTRLDPEYQITAGEQLAIMWTEEAEGPELVVEALGMLDTFELLQIDRQLRGTPDTLLPGEVGASKVVSARLREVVRAILVSRRRGEGPDPVDSAADGPDAPINYDLAGNRILGRADDPAVQAMVDDAKDSLKSTGATWSPEANSALEIHVTEAGMLEVRNRESGKVFGTHGNSEVTKAVKQIHHIRKDRTGARRTGTQGSLRAKVQTEMDPDEGFGGTTAEVDRLMPERMQTAAVQDPVEEAVSRALDVDTTETDEAEGDVTRLDEDGDAEVTARVRSSRGTVLADDIRRDLIEDRNAQREFHVEQMLLPDLVGAGFNTLAEARRAAQEGTLPDTLDPDVREVLEGKAGVPTQRQVQQAIQTIADQHAGQPGTAGDADGGANRVAARYLGGAEARNTNRLTEAVRKASQDGAERDPGSNPLMPPQTAQETAQALASAQEEAVLEGNMDSGLSAASMAASMAEEAAARAEVRGEAHEANDAERAGREVPGPDVAGHVTEEGGPQTDGVGPGFDGTLYDPDAGEQVLYDIGARAFMRGDDPGGDKSGFHTLLEYAMTSAGNDAVARVHRRALRNGAIMGTHGNVKLLGLLDMVFGQRSGSAEKSWKKLVKDSFIKNGDRIRDRLRQVTADGKPIFTEAQMKRLSSMGPFAVAAMGASPHLRNGVETDITRGKFIHLIEDMIGKEGANPTEQLTSARAYLKGVDESGRPIRKEFAFPTEDELTQAAGFIHGLGKRMRKYITEEMAWKAKKIHNEATGQTVAEGVVALRDIRGKIAEIIVRAATGRKGRVSTTDTVWLENLDVDEKQPRALATQIIEDLAGVRITGVNQSVTTDLRAVESSTRLAPGGDASLTELSEDVRRAREEDGLDPEDVPPDRLHLEAMKSANFYGRKWWERLSRMMNPMTLKPLVSAEDSPDSEWGAILLNAMATETTQLHGEPHPLHNRLREMFIAENPETGAQEFERASRDAAKAMYHARQLGHSLWLKDDGTKERPNEMGHTEFEALAYALDKRAFNGGYAAEWSAQEIRALGEFGLLEERHDYDGTPFYILSQGRVTAIGQELGKRLAATTTTPEAREELEVNGDNVLLYSFDPSIMLYGGHYGRTEFDPDKWFNSAHDIAQRTLHRMSQGEGRLATAAERAQVGGAVRATANLILETKGFLATHAGRTSKSKLKVSIEREQDYASKNSMARGTAARKLLKEQASLVIANHLSKLNSTERPLFTELIDGGHWQSITGPSDLANRLGVQNAENMYRALESYNMAVLELGRMMVDAGALPVEVFNSFTKNGKTRYMMRANWPTSLEARDRAQSKKEQFANASREMFREKGELDENAARITDPTLLTSRQFAQESARVGLYSVLRDAAYEWGIPTEHARELIPAHNKRHFRLAAVPPGVTHDPFNGKRVKPWQHAMWVTLSMLDNQMNGKDKSVHRTKIKQDILNRILTEVNPEETKLGRMDSWAKGILVSDTTGKQLEILLDDFNSASTGEGVLDYATETLDVAAKWWRRGRTVMRFKHVSLSIMSSFLTNHFAGTANLSDVVKGFLLNRGPYADAARGLELFEEYVRAGRSWDLAQMGDDGALIQDVDFLLHRMGGSTMVSAMLDTVDMRDTFHHLVEMDPNFQFQLERSGSSADVVSAMMRDAIGRRPTLEGVDRRMAAAFGNQGAGPESVIEGIQHATALYESSEALMKIAAYLAKKRDNPEHAGTLQGRQLLADAGIAGTGDYSEANPWLYEMTARFRRSEVQKAFSTTPKTDAAWYAMRMMLGTPFMAYNFVMFPTLARSMASPGGALRTAVGASLWSGLLTAMARSAFDDEEYQLTANSGGPAMPTLQWPPESLTKWDEMNPGGRWPGIWQAGDGIYWRREGVKFAAKVGEGVAYVVPGPNGDGRKSMIDATQQLGGHPIEHAMRALQGGSIASRVFDNDPGRARAEGVMGWLFQQSYAARVLNPFGPREKNRTRGEAAVVELTSWLQRNIGSDMNPATAIMSDTSVRFFEATVTGGTPLREAIAGMRRPEAEAEHPLSRIGTAALASVFHLKRAPDDSVFESRHYDNIDEFTTAILGDIGMKSTDPVSSELEHRAGIAHRRSVDAVKGIFRGSFELVSREGAFGGGMQADLFPRIAIWDDIELFNDPDTGDSRYQLRAGKRESDMSDLGRFIARQPKSEQSLVISAMRRNIQRAFDTGGFEALVRMSDRRAVDGAVAIRVFDALLNPRSDALLLAIKDGIEDDSPGSKRTWFNVWNAMASEIDRTDLKEELWSVYDSVGRRMQTYAYSHVDVPSPLPREVLKASRFDLLPRTTVVTEDF